MASRPHEDHELDGVKFRFEALSYEKATDMLADVFQLVSKTLDTGIGRVLDMFKSGRIDFAKLKSLDLKDLDPELLSQLLREIAPVLVTVSNELAAHKDGVSMLKWLEGRLFENSTAVYKNAKGEKERLSLIDKDDRAALFEQHPSTFLLALFLAGKVTFARYFPGAGAAAAGSTRTSAAAALQRESDDTE
jgi:hypothetical protein